MIKMYYLLNMMTGILECGWIAFGLAHAMPLWQILCYPLAYYLGKLFPKPFSLSKKVLLGFCSAALIAAVILTAVPMPDILWFVLICLCLFLLSAVIQTVKDDMKSSEHSLLKRFFRVAGFALSPLAAFRPQIILFVAVVIAFCGLTKYTDKEYHFTVPDFKGGYSIAILFHQLHYFFYTHITIAAVSLALSKQPPVIDALDYAFTRNPAVFGSIAGILIFCGTQIIYILSEHIFSRLTKKSMTVFYIGQTAVFVILLSMSFITDTTLFVILWLFTGLCGGTVCTITKKLKQSVKYDKAPTTFSENAGCILGLLAAILVSVFFGTYSPDIMLVCGAISTLATILCMIITMQKEKKYDGIG